MKRCFLVGTTIFLVLLFNVYGENIGRIVAKVNGEIITEQDVVNYLHLLKLKMKDYFQKDVDEQVLKKQALESLIEDRLVIQEAKKMGVQVDDKIINSKFREIVERFGSYDAFEKFLVQEGLTVPLVKKKIKEQYLLSAIMDMKIRSKISVSPQEVTDFYEKNKDLFIKDKEFVCRIIKLDSLQEAEELKELIRTNGIDNVGQDYRDKFFVVSESKEGLQKGIYEAVKNLKIGGSAIVELDDGIFLVYLDNIKPAYCPSLDKVKDKVYNYFFQKRFEKSFQEWVDELKKDAVIEIYEKD